MNEYDLQDTLEHLLDPDANSEEVAAYLAFLNVSHVTTFEDAGVLTGNKGLVVTTDDGSEFQLTIVQSR